VEVTLGSRYHVRDQLVEALERDLVGPHEEEETLADAPFATYVTGVLYPADAGTPGVEQEVDESDDSDETTYADPPVSLANTRYPSSLGFTFAVDITTADRINLAVTTARYAPLAEDEAAQWRRIPLSFSIDDFDVSPSSVGQGERELEPGLHLYHRIRAADDEGVTAVTLILINRRHAPAGKRDADSYYQVKLTVDADGRPAFTQRSAADLPVSDEDLESYRLIYRNVRSYAVGHGTSVSWIEEDTGRASEVATNAVPRYELLLADSNPEIPNDGLSMLALSGADRVATVGALRLLTDGYDAWIASLEGRVNTLPESLRDVAREHITTCRGALERMRSGADRIERDDPIWRAFQLANLAMLRQRARAAWVSGGRQDDGPVEDDTHAWRPFQIAFFLLNVDGLADGAHPDRGLLDLLWFPTGGGKTEAYLGLIAFTIMLRRIRHGEDGRGVTVLMRYTLRLLTMQQFERAAAMICALEDIRRQHSDLGQTPVSIGLWVGRDGTPATVADARSVLDKLRVGARVDKGNPVQLRACPWCGVRLDHKAYWITKHDPRLVISCRNDQCQFSKGLPVHVVDEDIYRERPSLIIATADKFATLPWVQHGHALFGVDESGRPPELIVQDELHLISGPLGTLAGLYESAIDLLCTMNGIRPKVIASTATIRRARAQANALFDREMRQFPPSGLDAENSYFAITAPRNEKAARLYVGAMAPGTSQSTLMIRSYAALMQAIADVDAPDAAKDPYWTLVGYFNSLRVLGGARIQVLDDVRDRLKVLSPDRDPREPALNIELTSREPSSEIPGHLEALTRELPSDETLDYVLATNMISVGVDVDRLGLMVVMGQPQATAEYIQATSRVGRRHPGLVLTLYNAGRSRDRSHYESFPTYHAGLYRQVESTSVTPFSPRARDRALHAVLLTLARTAVPALRASDGARRIEDHVDELTAFGDALARRAERIAKGNGEPQGIGDAVRGELERIIELWRARNREAPKLVYANPRDEVNSLLTSADRAEGDGLPTPSSLRDVDRESNLYLIRI
jgi:hypothetical protein